MINKISQSFMKDYAEYLAGGGCGELIQEKYVNGNMFPDEEPGATLNLGICFEYWLSGALPKNGKVPQPEYMVSGLKKEASKRTPDDMLAPYRRAFDRAKVVRDILSDMGLEIIGVAGDKEKVSPNGYIFTMHFDLHVKCVREVEGMGFVLGEELIIDTKYSGLMTTVVSWKNKHGWQWSEIQKAYHGTQGKQYTFVSDLQTGFLVTSSGEKEEIRLFLCEVSEHLIKQHIMDGEMMFDNFSMQAKYGFAARPEFNKCKECVFFDGCTKKHTFPRPILIDLHPHLPDE